MKRLMSMIVAVAFLLSVAPAVAAPEQVTTLPEVRQVSSLRFDFATSFTVTVEGETFTLPQVGGRGVATAAGQHVAFYDAVENVVLEVIIYGDTAYVRTGNETRWKSTRLDPTTPIADIEELPAGSITTYRLEDEVVVRGTPTTQYQRQVAPSAFPANSGFKALNQNFFIAKTDNSLLKEQTTLVATDPTVGDYTFQAPTEYYAFNDPTNIVNRPPADLVDAAQIDMEFPGFEVLKPWARLFVAQQLAELRAR